MYNTKHFHIMTPVKTFKTEIITVWKVKSSDYTFNAAPNNLPKNLLSLVRGVEGSGELYLKDQKPILIGPESMILIKYSDRLGWQSKSEPWEYIWYNFTTDEDIPFLQLNTLYNMPISFSEKEKFEKMFNLTQIKTVFRAEYANIILTELLYSLIFQIKHEKKSSKPFNKEIQQSIAFIKDNIKNNIDFKILAHDIFISERYFRKLFTEETGMPPKRFHKYERVKAAVELLSNDELNLAQIAERLGYNSQFHLTRDFNDFFGMSPSSYKKQFI